MIEGLFVVMFVALGIYGITIGKVLAGAISLAMAGFACFAARWFAAQERRFNASPESARTIPDTDQELVRHCCECTRSDL